MKHNGMANRANRGIRDDVSYEVVFGEKTTQDGNRGKRMF